MLRNLSILLLGTAAPMASFAQQVELRSSDEFISIQGEIVGFNGFMVSIETSVGRVSVPASEVICYGDGCDEIIQNNDFGLTAAAFAGIDAGSDMPDVNSADDFIMSFEAPRLNSLYTTVAGAFVVASETSTSVELGPEGLINLTNVSSEESATIALAAPGGPSDMRLGTVSLQGTAELAFAAPAGWANAAQMPSQLVGIDAFAVVAAPNVGITTITIEDLARIFAGELTNWSQIGGADLAILPLQLPETSPIRNELVKLIMEPFGKSMWGDVLTMADETGLALSVNQFPGSVSIVGTKDALNNATLSVAGACGVGVAPTPFNIKSGDYPLIRPLMVTYDRQTNTGLLTELFDFASTDVAQDLLERAGFFNFSGIVQDTTDKNARLGQLLNSELDDAERLVAAQMFQVLFEAERLSPTMTGGASSGPEGAWNRAMMRDLAEMLRDPAYSGKEVVFAGFAQSENGSQAEIDASRQAASEMQLVFSQFAPAVINANGLSLTAIGFGGVAPSTCYNGQIAGQISTHVEVWVR